MKLEFVEKEEKKYYDELYYISYKYSELVKKPNKRVDGMTSYLLKYDILLFLTAVLVGISNTNKDSIGFILLGMTILMFINYFYYIIIYNKRIKAMLNKNNNILIKINDNGIDYNDNYVERKQQWDDIKYIIVNKYTLSFIPKDIAGLIINVPKKYKKEINESLKKYNKEYLLVDNTKLYK